MTARRSTTPAVTLFPFLAVLVCAMGALIFLLLITTRRIRQQTVEHAHAVAAAEENEASLPDPAVEPPAEPEPAGNPFDTPPPAREPTPPPLLVPPEPMPDPYEERVAELRDEWQHKVAGLELRQTQLNAQLAEIDSSLTAEGRKVDLQQTALQRAQQQLDEVQRSVAAARSDKQSQLLRQSRIENDIHEQQARLKQVQEEHAQAAGRFEILPYDGRTGTTRRPILIECTEHGFNFLSDDVQLGPDDVNGFTPQQNPLLAGAEALLNFWKARELNSQGSELPTDRPYVLLIVRPGGTLAYYIARRLLEPLDEPFGYELVTDQKFVAPASDPQAKAVLQRAIQYMLRERERLAAQTRNGALPVADSLRFSDGNGKFYLDEVQRLRENSETVNFGGREVERNRPGNGYREAATPRIVELPRPSSGYPGASTAQTPAAGGNPLAESRGLYDSKIAPHVTGDGADSGAPPPRRRTFNADGPVASTENLDQAGRDQTGRDQAGRGHAGDSASQRQGPHLPGVTASPVAQSTNRSGHAGGPLLRANRGGEQINVDDPQWGIRDAGSSIGLERDVTIHVSSREVRVGDERPLTIKAGVSREELQQDLANTLDAHVRSWGRPPNSFFWLPSVHFEVAPGGHQYYQRLNDLIKDWQLRSTVEFVLE